MANSENEKNQIKVEEPLKFKGKYTSTIGRRKTATARVRIYKKGTGVIAVNDEKINNVFTQDILSIVKQPLKLTNHLRDFSISAKVDGGGKKSQAEAIRHGIARGLVEIDEELKPAMKIKGWLTRDARRKERKKPGLKKARKRPQWSKR